MRSEVVGLTSPRGVERFIFLGHKEERDFHEVSLFVHFVGVGLSVCPALFILVPFSLSVLPLRSPSPFSSLLFSSLLSLLLSLFSLSFSFSFYFSLSPFSRSLLSPPPPPVAPESVEESFADELFTDPDPVCNRPFFSVDETQGTPQIAVIDVEIGMYLRG